VILSEVAIIYGYYEGCKRVEAIEALYKMSRCKNTAIRINKGIAASIKKSALRSGGDPKGVFMFLGEIPKNIEYGKIELTLDEFWKIKDFQAFIRQNTRKQHQYVYKIVYGVCHCCKQAVGPCELMHFVDLDGNDSMICYECIESKPYETALEQIGRNRNGLQSEGS